MFSSDILNFFAYIYEVKKRLRVCDAFGTVCNTQVLKPLALIIIMKEEKNIQNQLLAIVCSVFDAYSATLYLPCENGNEYELVASFSLGDKSDFRKILLPGLGLAGWILRNNQPLVVANFDQHNSNLGYYLDEVDAKIKAFMGCPIPAGGVLCVDSKRQYSFSDKDNKILQMFADIARQQCGLGGNAALAGNIPEYFVNLGVIQGLRFQHKRWPIFLQNFLSTMASATKFKYCAFASIDSMGDSYNVEGESTPLLLQGNQHITIPLSNGIVGWILRDESQPIFSEGFSESVAPSIFGKIEDFPTFRAVICMPVMVNKSVRGVLCLANPEPQVMDEALRSFVHQCVDNLALFLENLYLKSRLHQLLPKAFVHNEGSVNYDLENDAIREGE